MKSKNNAIKDLKAIKKALIGSDGLFDKLWAIDYAIEVLGEQVKDIKEIEVKSDENVEVHVMCYGKKMSFKNKDEAIEFFLDGVCNSEGAERARYDKIIDQLISGKTECSD